MPSSPALDALAAKRALGMPDFETPGMPKITDPVYLRRVSNYESLKAAERTSFRAWNYLRTKEVNERTRLTILANKFWDEAKEAAEAAKADK